MYIASKFEDIFPIKIKTLLDNVAHNKFTQ